MSDDKQNQATPALAVAPCSAPLVDAAFAASVAAAQYSYGSLISGDAWKDVACDMRDLARKLECR